MNKPSLLFCSILFLVSLSVCVAGSETDSSSKDTISATLKLNTTGVHSPYFINVKFKSYQDSASFLLKKFGVYSADNPTKVFYPSYISSADLNDNHGFKIVNLFDTLLLEYKDYRVDYIDPQGKKTTIVVARDPSCNDSLPNSVFNIARWLNRNTHVNLDVRQIIRTQNAVAVDYQFELQMLKMSISKIPASTMFLSILSSGKLSTDSNKTPNTLDAAIAFAWLNHAYLPGDEWMHYGLRIPIGFEGPQSFSKDSLQISAKIQAACSIPYLSELLIWWHRAIKYRQPFIPPIIYAGYTYNNSLDNSDSSISRFDGELVFNAPLAEDIVASFTGRASYVDKNWKTSFDVSTNLTVSKVVGFILKYSRGELAPFFRKYENFGMGVSVIF